MNNIKISIISISIVLFSACTQTETEYTTSATIYLINETNVVVKSDDVLGYVIQPKDTLIHTESYTSEYNNKPSIDNYDPFPPAGNIFIYGDNSQCERGIDKIENYENRREISELEFEFTFRFTEEKRENAEPCNL
ncbi:MAG: hypothetical protein AB8B65_01730 [Kordia sp.]|uniref:hypothetical protein n=1 Tax=Kordia sp. TaxID=1965332 RepID=UPI00385F89CB